MVSSIPFLVLVLLCLSLTWRHVRSQNFTLITSPAVAPWSSRSLVYSTIVYTKTDSGFSYEPLLVGGVDGLNEGYDQDVWVGNGVLAGSGWKPLPTPPFSGRAAGGMFNVLVSQQVQIILLAGGRDNSGLRNDIWYSTTVGVTWSQFPQENIQWSPRELFGFVIAASFGGTSTIYGYLLGGNTINGVANDFYYSKGQGTTNPWERMPDQYQPLWTPRYAFGCAPNAGNQGIVISGGILSNGDLTNEVWIWNLEDWVVVAPNFFSSYVNLVRTATNNFYILESLLGSGPESPTFIDSEVYQSEGNPDNFVGVGTTPVNPRYQASTPIDPNNIAYSLGGSTNQDLPAGSNDVWYIQLS